MNVLLIGEGDFEEIELLADAIADRGGDPVVCDVTAWPGERRLAFDPNGNEVVLGRRIDPDELVGAYVSVPKLFHPTDLRFHESLSDRPRPTLNQVREHRAMFESACRRLDERGVEMLPRFEHFDWHDHKPWQLAFLDDAGIPIPDTLFTNSPEEVVAFFETHEDVIYKPVTMGGGPKRLTEADLTESRLDDLATAPVQFQAFVPGDDLRVYCLDGDVVGAIRYRSDSFSFKVDAQEGREVDFEPYDPPAGMVDAVETACERAGLGFGAADVRLRPDGEFAVLEVNNSPRFAAADRHCDQNVAGHLADYLLGQ